MRNPFSKSQNPARTHPPTQLFITDIMSHHDDAFVALSLFVLSVNFYHYFGGEFPLVGSGFYITALDFDI